jgi:hypothetical protein
MPESALQCSILSYTLCTLSWERDSFTTRTCVFSSALWAPNAAPQPLPEAGARDERTLCAVACMLLLGMPHERLGSTGTASKMLS